MRPSAAIIVVRALLPVLVAVLVPFAAARAEGADPALNRPYLDPEFSQWVARFESPGRETYDRRSEILAAAGVKPGMHVADVGAGTGLFTLMFSPVVGREGRVYAVDISKTFVENILRRAREAGFENVTGIVNSQDEAGLAPGSVDLAFVCDTYHHFERPRTMLRSMRRALRPGGTLVVIDFERIEGVSTAWVLGHVRAGRAQVIREIEREGFRLVESPAVLKQNFFLKFVRSD